MASNLVTVTLLMISFVKEREGLKLNAYPDGESYAIGYGFHGPGVMEGISWDDSQASFYLIQDLQLIVTAIRQFVHVPMNDNQAAALASLCYNVGCVRVSKSKLVELINAQEFENAADEFLSWNKVNGEPCHGLTNRREAERELFLKP